MTFDVFVALEYAERKRGIYTLFKEISDESFRE